MSSSEEDEQGLSEIEEEGELEQEEMAPSADEEDFDEANPDEAQHLETNIEGKRDKAINDLLMKEDLGIIQM